MRLILPGSDASHLFHIGSDSDQFVAPRVTFGRFGLRVGKKYYFIGNASGRLIEVKGGRSFTIIPFQFKAQAFKFHTTLTVLR